MLSSMFVRLVTALSLFTQNATPAQMATHNREHLILTGVIFANCVTTCVPRSYEIQSAWQN